MKEKLLQALEWVKLHGKWILLLLFGAFTGAKLLRDRLSKVETVDQAFAVEAAKRQIKSLRVERDAIDILDKEKAEQAEVLAKKIAMHEKNIVEIHTGKSWEEMSNEELNAALRAANL